MAQKASFDIRLQGLPAANRDAQIKLVSQVTGAQIIRKPFLDGQLLVRDLDPGPYELTVSHPNLISPIDKRMIRLFPQPFPTRVPVPVPPDLFRDSPIRDVPDADLSPIQQLATSVKQAVGPIGGKAPGEVIRSDDWNTLVSAVSDLSSAVLELTRLVSPVGHNHPEIEEKIGEVQGNIRRFIESFGKSLVELRRDIENQNLRKNVRDVLTLAGRDPNSPTDPLIARVADLELAVNQTSPVFSTKLANTGSVILNNINVLANERDDPDAFLADPAVTNLVRVATQYQNAGTQSTPEEELKTYSRTGATQASKFNFVQP
jgi:hypothetical protein